jgi:hypothetical protein
LKEPILQLVDIDEVMEFQIWTPVLVMKLSAILDLASGTLNKFALLVG